MTQTIPTTPDGTQVVVNGVPYGGGINLAHIRLTVIGKNSQVLTLGIGMARELADVILSEIAKITRPEECCGVCPPTIDGGYDCTCKDNPRCQEVISGAEVDASHEA